MLNLRALPTAAWAIPEARHRRRETDRFRRFSYEDLMKRDKVNLDIFWLRDESMEDTANLPPPYQIAEEIVEDLRSALEQLEEIAAGLSPHSRQIGKHQGEV